MNLKTQITQIHYNKNASGLLFSILRFCSIFYGFGSSFKNFLYDKNFLKPKKVDAYVISVGNFTTGGVGKTPIVYEIAKYFVDKGEKVAIVSRGYGGKLDNKKVNLISDGINLYYKADMSGDEPYWLAVNLNLCAVLTCANRYKAAKYAVDELGVTKIILDDGFQHRKMARNLDIVLADSEKMFGNENLLPAGPLRESISGFNRVDRLVIVSKNTEHEKAENIVTNMHNKYKLKTLLAKVEPEYAYNIISGEHLNIRNKVCDDKQEVTAICAIGQPEQFYAFVEKDYKIKNKITFDDHHQYTIDDIKDINGDIITTEKDAVKLALLGRNNIYALKLKTVLDVENLIGI